MKKSKGYKNIAGLENLIAADIKQRNLETYGESIKKYRKKAGLTVDQLASLLQITNSSVKNWESGYSRPDPEYLYRMFTILDVEPNEFFGIGGIGTLLTTNERNLVDYYRTLDDAGKEDLETIAQSMSDAGIPTFLADVKTVASGIITAAQGMTSDYEKELFVHDAIINSCSYVAPEVYHLETVVLEERAADVLADVVDVALHRRDDDRPPHARAVALGERRAHDIERRARRLRRHEELREENATRLKSPADDLKSRHDTRADYVQWRDALCKFFSRRRRRIGLEPMPNGVGQPRTRSRLWLSAARRRLPDT